VNVPEIDFASAARVLKELCHSISLRDNQK